MLLLIMEYLKTHTLLLIKSESYTYEFDSIFKAVIKIEDNSSLIKIYHEMHPSIIFMNCTNNPLNSIDLIKQIRKRDQDTYIAVFTHEVYKSNLLKVIPLQIFDCIIYPNKFKIKHLLTRLNNALKLNSISHNYISLKDGYKYNQTIKKIITHDKKEIHLTHKEIILLDLLLANKGEYLSMGIIIYTIWEEESLDNDCTGRLKALINGLRKKLPNNSIENQYGLGYHLIFS